MLNGFIDLSAIHEYFCSLAGRRTLRAALVLLAALTAWSPARAQELLEPEQAFRLEARMTGPETLEVTWRIAADHYMYRQAFSVTAPEGGVVLGEPSFPEGKVKRDEFFGETVVYESDMTFTVPVTPIADGLSTFTLQASGQGCNEPLGVCYPPITSTASVQLAAVSGASRSPMSPAAGGASSTDPASALLEVEPAQQEFLHPDDAFRFELSAMGPDAVLARFSIEPGYYLYKDKLSIESADPAVTVERVRLPEGKPKTDEYFGDVVVFYDGLDAQAGLVRDSATAKTVPFELQYQGCAEDGICYPPVTKQVSLRLPAAGAAAPGAGAASTGPGASAFQAGYWPVLLAFGSGLLLTFTPCVLPMVPILAGIIVGQGSGVTRLRGGALASVYVLGTAATYTAVGIVAGLTGDQLQAYFQNIWAIGFVAALLVLMALSMFGLYELKMPSGVQTRLQHRASGLQAGAVGGVFLMGMVSALIVGACVSPILISVLGLAINRGDPVLGGAIMFAMALGMGVFLVVMGFGFGSLLPRAGPWMERVKHLFGILLIAVAVYLLGAIPQIPVLYLWSALLVGTAVYLGARGSATDKPGWKVARQLVAVALVAWGVLAALGGVQGNRDILDPVSYRALAGDSQAERGLHARFQTVKDETELARLMEAAAADGKPVMVDYYADWCVDCVRMEKNTFADPRVARVLNRELSLIQVDVTDPDDPGTRAIKQSHGVFGPPAMLFFDAQGDEVRSMRRYGYMDSTELLDHIDPLLSE